MRAFNVTAFVALLAVPVGAGGAGSPLRVSLVDASGEPYSDIEVSLVGLDTGRAVDVRSDPSGVLQTTLVGGDYVIDLTRSGLAIESGPRVIRVQPGQWAFAVLRLKPAESEPGATLGGSNGDFGPDDNSDWWHPRPRKCRHKHHFFPCPVSPSR